MLKICEKRGQQVHIVRSKSDQNIRNYMGDDEAAAEARRRYVQENLEHVKQALERTEHSPRPLYLASKNAIRQLINGQTPPDDPVSGLIDEISVLTKLGLRQ